MATIRNITGRKNPWQVQIRLTGKPAQSKSFRTQKEAKDWARETETELVKLTPSNEDCTLEVLIERYLKHCGSYKSFKNSQQPYLTKLSKHPIAKIQVSKLKLKDFEDYIEYRLDAVKPSSVTREIFIYRGMLKVAQKWGLPIGDWWKDLKYKSKTKVKQTRIDAKDTQNILEDIRTNKRLSKDKADLYVDLWEFALETGLRRGELLKLTKSDYEPNFDAINVTDTKNGEDRLVALTPKAKVILEKRLQLSECSQIFPVHKDAVKSIFRRTFGRCSLKLRFHDARHEAVSGFFEKGLTTPEVRSQSGHKTIACLDRYAHPKIAIIRDKLKSFT